MFGLLTGKEKRIKQYLNEGATIIDVRSTTEFEGGHLKNSKNIPLDSLPKHIGQLDKTKTHYYMLRIGHEKWVG